MVTMAVLAVGNVEPDKASPMASDLWPIPIT